MSISSSEDYSMHPVDRMYSSQRRIGKGTRAVQDLSNDCCHEEGKIGAVAGGIIGTGVFAAIPPFGLWCPLGALVGGLIGGVIGESCRNVNHNKD